MVKYKPVEISRSSFAFCRYGLAAVIWLSFFYKSIELLAFACLIFLLSAILKVKRAPMIVLFDFTIDKFLKSPKNIVNQNSIFFAHTLAFILSLICLLLVTLNGSPKSWYFVLAFALLKTVSAFGFCPASKLYDCALEGKCCMKSSENELHS